MLRYTSHLRGEPWRPNSLGCIIDGAWLPSEQNRRVNTLPRLRLTLGNGNGGDEEASRCSYSTDCSFFTPSHASGTSLPAGSSVESGFSFGVSTPPLSFPLLICQALGINVLPCLSTRSVFLTPPSSHRHTSEPLFFPVFLLLLSVHLSLKHLSCALTLLSNIPLQIFSFFNHIPTKLKALLSSDLPPPCVRTGPATRHSQRLFCVLERHVEPVRQALLPLEHLVSTKTIFF